jgi:hypothetical protein
MHNGLTLGEWPDLQRLIDRWPTLEPRTRDRIIALVETAPENAQDAPGRIEAPAATLVARLEEWPREPSGAGDARTALALSRLPDVVAELHGRWGI